MNATDTRVEQPATISLSKSSAELAAACHRELPWFDYPPAGTFPKPPADLGPIQYARLDKAVSRCRWTNSALAKRAMSLEPRETVDEESVRQAWKKFFFSHFAFFVTFGCLTDHYRRALDGCRRQDAAALDEAIDGACALWPCAGAVMLYGVDFSPTEVLYKEFIRDQMPEGLSGTWLAEYQELQQCKIEWKHAVKRHRLDAYQQRLMDAEGAYHKHHREVMRRCVPELVSRLQEYEMEHGPLEVDDEHLAAFDRWFHIRRSPELDLSGYIDTTCQVLSVVHTDIVGGTWMPPDAITLVANGFEVLLATLSAGLQASAASAGGRESRVAVR